MCLLQGMNAARVQINVNICIIKCNSLYYVNVWSVTVTLHEDITLQKVTLHEICFES